MGKKERPLAVEIPRPADEKPAWSRVGIIAVIGFVLGVAWPRLTGVTIGPSVPGDVKPQPEANPSAEPAAPASAGPAPATSAEPGPKNEQLVVLDAGVISRCSDKKDKKIDDCGALAFDRVALPKLKGLASCPSAIGLDGKLTIGVELNFEKKEVQVVKGKKKSSLPSSTINGILECAARELSGISLDDIPHEHRRYTLLYTATFHPPGKHPDDAQPAEDKGGEDGEDGEGKGEGATAGGESAASGVATISWDTALIRSEPKTGEIVARLTQGTRVKLIGRQSDWYKIEHRGKTGWVYRGALGL